MTSRPGRSPVRMAEVGRTCEEATIRCEDISLTTSKALRTHPCLEVEDENDLKGDLGGLDDAVDRVKLVGEVVDVRVEGPRDDGERGVEEGEEHREPHQGHVQVGRLDLVLRLVEGQNYQR